MREGAARGRVGVEKTVTVDYLVTGVGQHDYVQVGPAVFLNAVDHHLETFAIVHGHSDDLGFFLQVTGQEGSQLTELTGAVGSPVPAIEDQNDVFPSPEAGQFDDSVAKGFQCEERGLHACNHALKIGGRQPVSVGGPEGRLLRRLWRRHDSKQDTRNQQNGKTPVSHSSGKGFHESDTPQCEIGYSWGIDSPARSAGTPAGSVRTGASRTASDDKVFAEPPPSCSVRAMCSILAVLELDPGQPPPRKRALALSRLQRHRGPDWSGVFAHPCAILAHERLAIVDVENGAQPLFNPERTHVLAVNGEIYNHRELEKSLKHPYEFQTGSDCEVILALYAQEGTGFLDRLNGIFAFVLYDVNEDRYIVARDPPWDRPSVHRPRRRRPVLRRFRDEITDPGVPYRQRVSSRTYSRLEGGGTPGPTTTAIGGATPPQLASRSPRSSTMPLKPPSVASSCRTSLTAFCFRGGLDSSIISALAQKFARRRVEDDGRSEAWWPRLHSFCIGLQGSPDLASARQVARHIGTVHHQFHFAVQEGLDALSDVIRHLETYDVTTVRAARSHVPDGPPHPRHGNQDGPFWRGSRRGLRWLPLLPPGAQLQGVHEETVRKLDRLHQFDCLRANKAMAAWGVEARVPFLDKDFLDTAMSIDPAAKMPANGIEKRILREAFAAYLPRRSALEAEGAVFRRRGLFLDRLSKGFCGREHQRPRTCQCALPLRIQHAPGKGSLLVPQGLRGAFPVCRTPPAVCPEDPASPVLHPRRWLGTRACRRRSTRRDGPSPGYTGTLTSSSQR